MILYKNKTQADVIEILQEQNRIYIARIGEYERNDIDEEIEILSNNKSDKFKLSNKNIISIRSADNYVEIFHREGDDFRKELIRSTLKGIEQQIKPYSKYYLEHIMLCQSFQTRNKFDLSFFYHTQ